ncbi:DUF2147 domain-containing protein [Burkholderia vietnamiensis]|uniref:DUF2147 domain-containing protein n=2 Tax=Burkholderia vietnamiensis TaxID=60552 RepID=A0AAW7SYD7_BURVI|nr:DUF2147 domain-containing protein [Burkholderia vietnamiensis]MDN7551316.1 DUF2147 domain-containing protein [Burkholderia vietnamiensis]MDN7795130.1 DUF2147 domain-containing protein [Burkholderia vietnamiensis]MDN8044962.1 DUF2147 domain-containing protein [Burkholderia vietnamiensis]MDN8073733.1 DUF2147 domain-containing protein [Burkholderia vietnamiensis]
MAGSLRQLAAVCALFVGAASAFADTTSPVGVWKSIDDSSGQPRSLIEISRAADGTLQGVVVQELPVDNPAHRCTSCTDDRKDQVIKGMTVIRGLKQDGDEWSGGNVLDPDSGRIYRCKIKLADAQHLVVRGYLGVSLLGRSQTWVRQQ